MARKTIVIKDKVGPYFLIMRYIEERYPGGVTLSHYKIVAPAPHYETTEYNWPDALSTYLSRVRETLQRGVYVL